MSEQREHIGCIEDADSTFCDSDDCWCATPPAAPVVPSPQMRPLIDWLRNLGEKRIGEVVSREQDAKSMRNSTVSDLRSAKILAEKMAGRKLPLASTSIESANEYADMQSDIAKKIEKEARQILAWADELETLPPASVATAETAQTISQRAAAMLEELLGIEEVRYVPHGVHAEWGIIFKREDLLKVIRKWKITPPPQPAGTPPLINRHGLFTSPDFPCPYCGKPVYISRTGGGKGSATARTIHVFHSATDSNHCDLPSASSEEPNAK